MVERLQEEILSMTVRKELLAKAMDQINQKHQVSLLGFYHTATHKPFIWLFRRRFLV